MVKQLVIRFTETCDTRLGVVITGRDLAHKVLVNGYRGLVKKCVNVRQWRAPLPA